MTADPESLKRHAATAALEEVGSGMTLGLGSGSTVAHFLALLGEALDEGRLREVRGVPSSVRTGRQAREAGIELVGLADRPRLDLTVDGADEVDPSADLMKGMGGALLREKMVAQASRRVVIIADESKSVRRLGTRSPLPVEVVDWGWQAHRAHLEESGAEVTVRRSDDDAPPYRSDNGNLLLDCRFPDGLPDPAALDAALCRRAGIVASGLFLGVADRVILAGPEGIRSQERAR